MANWWEHPNLQCAVSPIGLKLGADPDNFYVGDMPLYRGLASNGLETAEFSDCVQDKGYTEFGVIYPIVTGYGHVIVKNLDFTFTNANSFSIVVWFIKYKRNGLCGGVYEDAPTNYYFGFPFYNKSNFFPWEARAIECYINVNGDSSFASSVTPSFGIHQAVFTKNGSSMKIAVDGVDATVGSPTYSGGDWTFIQEYGIGMMHNLASANDQGTDRILHWAMYKDYALTPAEILADYNEGYLRGYIGGTNVTPMVLSASAKRDKILLITDSIGIGYDKYLRNALPKNIVAYDGNNDSGTPDVITNFDSNLLQEQDYLVLGASIWDNIVYHNSVETYIANITTIIDAIQAIYPDLKIILPLSTKIWPPYDDTVNQSYDTALIAFAATKNNVFICSVTRDITNTWTVEATWYDDHVHLKEAGYAIIGPAIGAWIDTTFYTPNITSLSQSSGLLSGGYNITLTGTIFKPGIDNPTVTINSIVVEIVSATNTTVIIKIPAGSVGLKSCLLTNSHLMSCVFSFEYTASSDSSEVLPSTVCLETNIQRWNGCSTDEKPYQDVREGSKYHAVDTGEEYTYSNGMWIKTYILIE